MSYLDHGNWLGIGATVGGHLTQPSSLYSITERSYHLDAVYQTPEDKRSYYIAADLRYEEGAFDDCSCTLAFSRL
jgi:hypothetical protein